MYCQHILTTHGTIKIAAIYLVIITKCKTLSRENRENNKPANAKKNIKCDELHVLPILLV